MLSGRFAQLLRYIWNACSSSLQTLCLFNEMWKNRIRAIHPAQSWHVRPQKKCVLNVECQLSAYLVGNFPIWHTHVIFHKYCDKENRFKWKTLRQKSPKCSVQHMHMCRLSNIAPKHWLSSEIPHIFHRFKCNAIFLFSLGFHWQAAAQREQWASERGEAERCCDMCARALTTFMDERFFIALMRCAFGRFETSRRWCVLAERAAICKPVSNCRHQQLSVHIHIYLYIFFSMSTWLLDNCSNEVNGWWWLDGVSPLANLVVFCQKRRRAKVRQS